MVLIIQSCPLPPSAGLRWKVSLMAPTSSVTLTKPLCCRGKSSPKHLWEERRIFKIPEKMSVHLLLKSAVIVGDLQGGGELTVCV